MKNHKLLVALFVLFIIGVSAYTYFSLKSKESQIAPLQHAQSGNYDSNQYNVIDRDLNFSDELELLRNQANLIVPTTDNGEIGVVFNSELSEEIAKQRISLAEQGHLSYEEQTTRYEYIVGKIKEAPSGAYKLDYYGSTNGVPVPFFPTFPDQKFMSENSESFLIPSGDNDIKQLHTNTQFGNLVIDESRNTSMTLEKPNIEVAGRASSFVHVKHKNNQWATKLYVPLDKDKLFVIAADQKIEETKGSFIDMAEGLVSNQSNY